MEGPAISSRLGVFRIDHCTNVLLLNEELVAFCLLIKGFKQLEKWELVIESLLFIQDFLDRVKSFFAFF